MVRLFFVGTAFVLDTVEDATKEPKVHNDAHSDTQNDSMSTN